VVIRLLGPIDVAIAGAVRPVAGLRPRAVLAVLGLSVGDVVSTDRLIDVVWDGEPPATALNTLQRHVSYLRGVLGERSAIVARASGYLLDLDQPDTDVRVATQLIAEGNQTIDPTHRLAKLQSALAQWRGRPLADVSGLSWFDGQAERLATLRDDAVQAIVDVRLELGQHAELIAELTELCRQFPYREHVHGRLMLALYRSGRRADALEAYQRLRRSLADDLGIDPGTAVRDLAAAILRLDPALDPPPTAVTADPVAPPPADPTPRQLPPDIGGFAGRDRELAELDTLLAAAGAAGAVHVAAVSGTAGVGKTALAVHWAHRAADQFPDGQLYVNLRAFEPTGAPMDPQEAVRGFLEAFGVPPQRVPESLHARVAMYRSLVAGKRVLVVLDNASDGAQVRPLLPGSASCLVVVTSRSLLTGLVAAEGAHPLGLDLLTADEAGQLLEHRLGRDRVVAEADAAAEIIERCARLPLALAIVAARASTEPHLALQALADELRDTGALTALNGGDPATDVVALFSWSYRQLSPTAAWLFRLLGLHPGPDITLPGAASLIGLPLARVRPALAELIRANLLAEHSVSRYACHDLLRGYAADLAHQTENEHERRAAIHRLLDHYLHTAYRADRLLYPHREPTALPEPQPGVVPEEVTGEDRALAWLTAERRVIRAAVDLAGATGFDQYEWWLPWTLMSFFTHRGYTSDWVIMARSAVSAAQRLGDTFAVGRARRNLAAASMRIGAVDDAYIQLRHSMTLAVQADDQISQAHTHYHLSRLRDQQVRHLDALHHAQQALELYRAVGHRRGEANALNRAGWSSSLLGDHHAAILACGQALAILQQFDDRQGHADCWHSLGYAHHHLGRYTQAVFCFEQALDVHTLYGDRPGEAITLTHLGDTRAAVGDRVGARRGWEQALAILVDLDHVDVDAVRARLNAP
jgi:DNA-binding SARP family transcriptional activator